ncbi:MAG: CsiV family protein [Stenotrophobium sp.]
MTFFTRLLICLSLSLLLPAAAWAETYRVDVIVFLNKSGTDGELGRSSSSVDMSHAIALSDTAALAAAGITVLPDSDFGLDSEWSHLRYAKGFQPLLRLCWIQKDPPESNGPALHVRWGEGFVGGSASLSPVDGTLSLLAGHYLHLDADLVYTQDNGNGGYSSYRLRENRLMRRDEIHHLDSPRLGILARVTRAGS